MKDRVSLGPVPNWGTYYGVMQVYPNLYGATVVNLSIQSPNNDPKYGVAEADDAEYAVLNNSVVMIQGDEDTQEAPAPDTGANAPFLQLAALVGAGLQLGPAGLGVGGTPTIVTATEATVETPSTVDQTNWPDNWFWGVRYKLTVRSEDNRLLIGTEVHEKLRVLADYDYMLGQRLVEAGWTGLNPFNAFVWDRVGMNYEKRIFPTVAPARKKMLEFVNGVRGRPRSLTVEQYFIYRSDIMDPQARAREHPVEESVYWLARKTQATPPRLLVQRIARFGAPGPISRGLIYRAASGELPVEP